VTHDVDAARHELAAFVAHDRESYGRWAEDAELDTGHRRVGADDLWSDPEYRVVTPDECVELVRDLGLDVTIPVHPMMGGLPPALAWESLHLIAEEVMPRVERAA
jgi:hypothetical protein